MITAKGKPQKAVDVIVAISVALKLKSDFRDSKIPARIPNDKEVTSNAKQLATNN